MVNFDLQGRKALVTGGARGLGAGMAQALAAAGASIVVADILDDTGEATVQGLRASGANAHFVHLDVTDEAQWEAAVNTTVQTLGGFDILVNNAGVEETALVADLSLIHI